MANEDLLMAVTQLCLGFVLFECCLMTSLPQELFLRFRIYSDNLRLDFQLFLYFMVGSDQNCSPEMEIVVEETASVREVRLAPPTALLPSSWTTFLAQNWRQRSWEEPCTE